MLPFAPSGGYQVEELIFLAELILFTPFSPFRGRRAGDEGVDSYEIKDVNVMRKGRAYLQKYARELRKTGTDAELLLWQRLRNRRMNGYKFRRQAPMGNYIVDFICKEARLVIELDGSQHCSQKEYDLQRTNYLAARGYRVVRYWNNQVLQESDAVLEDIRGLLETNS